MKVIYNKILPFGKKFAAINLFGIIFVKKGVNITPQLLNHEKIHSYQIRELLFIPFYIIYLFEWLYLLFKYKFNILNAYRNISFEREAYQNGDNLKYLNSRKAYSQWRKTTYY